MTGEKTDQKPSPEKLAHTLTNDSKYKKGKHYFKKYCPSIHKLDAEAIFLNKKL